MKYLRDFVIGSSCIVILSFYYNAYRRKKKNYKYLNYTLVAPIWFGIWNIISLIISEKYGLSKRLRFLTISILSSISIMLISYNFKTYNYTRDEWIKYFISIFIRYMITWNILIYYIDKYM